MRKEVELDCPLFSVKIASMTLRSSLLLTKVRIKVGKRAERTCTARLQRKGKGLQVAFDDKVQAVVSAERSDTISRLVPRDDF